VGGGGQRRVKGSFTGVGLPLQLVEEVDRGWRGGETGAKKLWREAVGAASQWWPRSGVVGAVRTRLVRGSDWHLMGGPSGFDIFLELSKLAQTWKLKKWMPYRAPKLPKFCTLLVWVIMKSHNSWNRFTI
jgi:hypothetical protein